MGRRRGIKEKAKLVNFVLLAVYLILFSADTFTTFMSSPNHELNPIIRFLWLINIAYAIWFKLFLGGVGIWLLIKIGEDNPLAMAIITSIAIGMYIVILLQNFYVLIYA